MVQDYEPAGMMVQKYPFSLTLASKNINFEIMRLAILTNGKVP